MGCRRIFVGLVLVVVTAAAVFADVKLPAIIGNNMVLQQGRKVPIWGWAEPNEQITVSVSWQNMPLVLIADKNGRWIFKIDSPAPGGPYEMTISGKNTITIKNILVGEVWVCSGQSNMEFSVGSMQRGNTGGFDVKQEIAEANYPEIRLFTVQKRVADTPQSNCVGNWRFCSPQTVQGFSAVAYFFGKELHKELNAPVGLINTSWGGTPAEAWTAQGTKDAA